MTWQNVSGATDTSYTVQEADEGLHIHAVTTVTNDNGVSIDFTSNETDPVLDALPNFTVQLGGEPQEGQVLTANVDGVQDDNTLDLQWRESADGGLTWANISGATGITYSVTEGDEQHVIDVVATVTNDNGVSDTEVSNTSITAYDALPTIDTPTITGLDYVGQVLTASADSGQEDNPVTYQWQSSSDGGSTWTNIVGATDHTYMTSLADEGHELQVVATATNEMGETISSTAQTDIIQPDLQANPDSESMNQDSTATFLAHEPDPGLLDNDNILPGSDAYILSVSRIASMARPCSIRTVR